MIGVYARAALAGELTCAERAELLRLSLAGPRAAEWIAGRLAVHRLLGDVDVVSAADGAPVVEQGHVSISHDDAWVAVAADAGPIGIDLCARVHATRVARILERLGVATAAPLRAWTALECALKLRRLGVWTLLDRELAIDGDTVIGIGAPVRVTWHEARDYVVAWGCA